jgi:predicted Rossmann fold nucleotide-binding protein DprA/Smf involved in DNA uptake
MFGMDLFIKSTEAYMKLAQQGWENMFKMMELITGSQTKEPAKKEASNEEKTAGTSEPPSAENVEKQVSKKTVTFPDLKTEPAPKDVHPSATAIASSPKTIPTKNKIKTKKKADSLQKNLSLKEKPSTAIDEVQAFISQQKQGASPEDVMKATGFNKKKVQHILYKLKKRGILKLEKGIYTRMCT